VSDYSGRVELPGTSRQREDRSGFYRDELALPVAVTKQLSKSEKKKSRIKARRRIVS